jgi:dTDP-4-amino-4,6-dideoxy-D-galactose acyltransferase
MTIEDYSRILLQQEERLYFYSPFKFLNDQDRNAVFVQTVLEPWLEGIRRGVIEVREIVVDSAPHYVLVERLSWDTEYFGYPFYKILTVLYNHGDYRVLRKAMVRFTEEIAREKPSFYFADIPSEDTHLIQVICECGFRLTETRLHYVSSKMDAFVHERYGVREATEQDIENLKQVATAMRNPYDRLHADVAFDQEVADAYVATYVENSVRGFADIVLVPAEGDGPPDGFHTCSLLPERILGKRIAKFGVVAVSNETRKGWHRKLLSETLHRLKDKQIDYILVNTQASNRRANRMLVSFGFELGYVTHIFSRACTPRGNKSAGM